MKQVLLRIPEATRLKLDEAATEAGRSLTAEVLARLESTFPAEDGWLGRAAKSPLASMERRQIAFQARLELLEERYAALEKRIDVLDRD
jgi:vacuolar-type H+-ATPase subunit E/Vma4